MISVEQALEQALALVEALPPETISLRDAAGRVLAEPIHARLTQPPFDNSSMDGYWLAAADHIAGAVLHVRGESAAGRRYDGPLESGQAVRIFTGAPCPPPNGIVVLQEDVIRTGDTITLSKSLGTKDNIRPRGQDFLQGDTFFPRTPLNPRDIGLIAAMNVAEVSVHRRPVVAILSTGDELVMPGDTPKADQIIASNGFILAAMVESAGAIARLLPIAGDTQDSLRAAFNDADGADVILTSGGASVGDHDLVGQVASDLGLARSFWKIAMRPGKPLIAGKLGDAAFLGLPGNPVSATICATLFVLPMLAKLQGASTQTIPRRAILAHDLPANGPRTHYMRATLIMADPMPQITAYDSQDSSRLTILAQANALLICPANSEKIPAGTVVDYLAI